MPSWSSPPRLNDSPGLLLASASAPYPRLRVLPLIVLARQIVADVRDIGDAPDPIRPPATGQPACDHAACAPGRILGPHAPGRPRRLRAGRALRPERGVRVRPPS